MMRTFVLVACVTAGCVDRDHNHPDAALAYARADLHCDAVDIMAFEYFDVSWHTSWTNYRAWGCSQVAVYDCPDAKCERVNYSGVTSTIAINGAPLVPNGPDLCHSGEAEGQAFFGVDLNDRGSALRIIREPDLTFELVATAATGDYSPPLVGCAQAQLTMTGVAVSGSATLDCAVNGWTVQGDVSFETCQ